MSPASTKAQQGHSGRLFCQTLRTTLRNGIATVVCCVPGTTGRSAGQRSQNSTRKISLRTGNIKGGCWKVCRKSSAILKLSGEKGQGMLVGSVLGKSVLLFSPSRMEEPVGDLLMRKITVCLTGPLCNHQFYCGTILIGPHWDHRFPLWDHPHWTTLGPSVSVVGPS
jgi:hypothetical protein